MSKVAIEVVRESLHFSAAHFTIFSATERERIHGHNFHVNGVFESEVGEDGLCFDYGDLKRVLQALCDELDERFLIPARSPYLAIDADDDTATIRFNSDQITMPRDDALLLPLRNITVEELATWFADRLRDDQDFTALNVSKMEIKVASGSGQWGVVSRTLT